MRKLKLVLRHSKINRWSPNFSLSCFFLLSSICSGLSAADSVVLDADQWNKVIRQQLLVSIDENYNEKWEPSINGSAGPGSKMRADGNWIIPKNISVEEKVNSQLASFARIGLINQPGPGIKYWSRIEGIVRGKHPYYLVFEDISSVSGESVFEWAMQMPREAEIKWWYFQNTKGQPYLADTRISQQVSTKERKGWIADNLIVRAFEFSGDRGAFSFNDWMKNPSLNWPGYFARFGASGDKPASQFLFVPGKAERPAFKIMLYPNDGKSEIPQTFWQENRTKLLIGWSDQKDEIRFRTTDGGRTNFTLERMEGPFNNQIVAFGTDYDPASDLSAQKGKLIGYWSFDKVNGAAVIDESGFGNDGKLFDQAHLTPGVSGSGLDPVSVPDLPPGEVFVVRDSREQQPPITFGRMIIPGKVMEPIKDAMTLSMWYSGPPTTEQGLFWPYAHLEKNPRRDCKNLFTVGGDPDPSKRKECWNDNFDFRIVSGWRGDGAYLSAVKNQRVLEMLGIAIANSEKWHHLALTMDKQNVKLYMDGKLAHETTLKKGSLLDLKKGEDIHVLDGLWGRIDELRLHDYALSDEQIEEIYRQDSAGLTTKTVFAGKKMPQDKGISAGDLTQWKDERGFTMRLKNVEMLQKDGIVSSAKFAPDSRMQIPSTLFFGKPLDGMTVAMKIKFNDLSGRVPIFSTNNHARNAVNIGRNGKMISATVLWKTAQTGQILEAGRWYDLAVACDNFKSRIFLDGKVVAEQEIYDEKNKLGINEMITVGQPLNNSKDPAFNGEIQNLQIFNYALPEESVKKLFRGEEINKPLNRKEQRASVKTEVFRSVPVKK